MKPERSPERRDLDWQTLIETALTAPGSIGNTYSRFHQYSFLNNLLLLMQGVEGPVATYDRWRSVGRQVLKGSKAAEIVRPITIAKKNEDGEVESSFTRFKFVKCIFGYNQTEGEGRMSKTFSSREYEEIARQLADRDLDIKPHASKRSTADSLDWERIRDALLNGLNS
jgi:hypothetical protein